MHFFSLRCVLYRLHIEETQEYLILILGEVFYQIDKWLSDKE